MECRYYRDTFSIRAERNDKMEIRKIKRLGFVDTYIMYKWLDSASTA